MDGWEGGGLVPSGIGKETWEGLQPWGRRSAPVRMPPGRSAGLKTLKVIPGHRGVTQSFVAKLCP